MSALPTFPRGAMTEHEATSLAFVPFAASDATAAPPPIGLTGLLRLRWCAVVGQLVMLAVARLVFELDLPWAPMLALVALTAATNAVLAVTRSPQVARPAVLTSVVVFDVLVLTALLGFSGGASNPVSVFFVVHVALAALLLRPAAVWSVVVLTIVAFGALFFVPASPLGAAGNHAMHGHSHAAMHGAAAHDSGAWSLHLLGMWGAYALSASLVAYFIRMITEAIAERDRRLVEAQRTAQRTERLATLSAFSAQAAHELATPLATIGLAAKELSRAVARGASSDSLTSDAELICSEISRCRGILADISSRAGQSVGEMPRTTTPREIVDDVVAVLARERLDVDLGDERAAHRTMVLPHATLVQMLVNLVRNAVEANQEKGTDVPVELRLAAGDGDGQSEGNNGRGGDSICFHVLDRGPGFSADVHGKLGEPFVTTKRDAGGLGLGVYLVRSFADRFGGELRYEPRDGGGLDASLTLPTFRVSSVSGERRSA